MLSLGVADRWRQTLPGVAESNVSSTPRVYLNISPLLVHRPDQQICLVSQSSVTVRRHMLISRHITCHFDLTIADSIKLTACALRSEG
jgi:hypothetical protein